MDVWWLVSTFAVSSIVSSLIYRFKTRRKVYYMESDMWRPIALSPLPEDIDDYICTDGKRVLHQSYVKYNSKGLPTMGWRDTLITHWMPLPQPPKE